jgi:hypothetical protein
MIRVIHPGSRFFNHPGSRGKKSTGSWIRIRNTGSRSPQPEATSIQARDQKAIFLAKSGKELEQDPCQSKAAKKCFKMATELSTTQWWKTPNWKEDEQTRKVVWTTTIA